MIQPETQTNREHTIRLVMETKADVPLIKPLSNIIANICREQPRNQIRESVRAVIDRAHRDDTVEQ